VQTHKRRCFRHPFVIDTQGKGDVFVATAASEADHAEIAVPSG
jgi:hypothetical protein